MIWTEQAAKIFSERLNRARSGDEKSFRQSAWSRYESLGLPDRKDELWKYTSLKPLQGEWREPAEDGLAPASAEALAAEGRVGFDIAMLLNGKWLQKSSSLTLEAGFSFGANVLPADADFEDGFFSLAAAVHQGGYRLNVAAGVKVFRPLMIIHARTGEDSWTSTVNSIALDPGAELHLIEIFVDDQKRGLRTDLTQVHLAKGARLHWVRLQTDSASALHASEGVARVEERASLKLTQLNSGAKWSRSSFKAEILGEAAEVSVNGLSLGRDDQHLDQRVRIRHMAGQSFSSQLFKSVLRDRSRSVVNGKIYIAQDAQKVVSSQINHSLLLSPGAEADTKPELEIYADDVKANHGASVGRLDEEKLFYLMSRGIARAEAERLLARAFVEDVLMKIEPQVLREYTERHVQENLPAFMAEST